MNQVKENTTGSDKAAAIAGFIELSKKTTAAGVTREGLDTILRGLIDIASHTEWWTNAEYAEPKDGELQARYFIHEEPDNTYALYLNVMKPGKKIQPHNHTTWACIAGVEGGENNFLYQRTDDGAGPGPAHVALTGEKHVGPGEGIALMADDIHAVQITGGGAIRHLHMYGLALEKLTQRLVFDTEENTCKVMSVGVKTQRSAA
jgi:predicted metal-dependent enzyme (double-stranded beta helix superfamily)